MNIEQDIKAAGADVAPRVTPADIEANITGEFYFTAADGVQGASGHRPSSVRAGTALGLLTFCVLVLRNGFTVTGESACASPANFNADIGRKVARENAIQKVWPLIGYALKEQMAFVTITGRQMTPLPVIDAIIEDFPLGKACDLSNEKGCEACQ